MKKFLLLISIYFLCFSAYSQSNYQFINKNKIKSHGHFSEGVMSIGIDSLDGMYGFIDSTGRIIIDFKYYKAKDFKEGLCPVVINKNLGWGFIDKNDNLIIDYQFYFTGFFSEKLCAVQNNSNKWGFINKFGDLVIDYHYDFDEDDDNTSFFEGYIPYFKEGLCALKKNGKYGFIDKNGNVVINFQFDNAFSFNEGIASVKKGDKWGFINKSGVLIIDYQFNEPAEFEKGVAIVSKKTESGLKYSIINKTGTPIINNYGDHNPVSFHEDLCSIVKNDQYGFIDRNGRIIIDFQFDYASFFREGVASVKKGDKWGFINKKGEVIIDFKYSNVLWFKNGLCEVAVNNKWGLINKAGEIIIDFKYDDIDIYDLYSNMNIQKEYFPVEKNGISGIIDKEGNLIVGYEFNYAQSMNGNDIFLVDFAEESGIVETYAIKVRTSEEIINEYLRNKLAIWQKRGEFEKFEDYQKRLEAENQKNIINEFTKEIIEKLIADKKQTVKYFYLGKYEPDNESFHIFNTSLGEFLLKVPIDEAPDFKSNWGEIKVGNTEFVVTKSTVILSKLAFENPVNNKKYIYDYKEISNYNHTQKNLDLITFEIDPKVFTDNNIKNSSKDIIVEKYVDNNIPINNIVNNNSFALIIGNENYKKEIKVPYAINDAKIFSEYCTKTLGIPEKQVHTLINGTYGEILGEIKWLTEVIGALNGDANIILYYAGHGIPDQKEKTAFILPVDGVSSVPQTAIGLDNIYKQLSEKPAEKVVVILDACFSGASRDGMLTQGRGVRITPKANVLSGNLVVLSATSNDEIALPYKEKQHGLFTYYLLDKLNKTKGNVTLEELYNYIYQNVKKQSVLVNQNSQNPNLIFSPDLNEEWKMMKLL